MAAAQDGSLEGLLAKREAVPKRAFSRAIKGCRSKGQKPNDVKDRSWQLVLAALEGLPPAKRQRRGRLLDASTAWWKAQQPQFMPLPFFPDASTLFLYDHFTAHPDDGTTKRRAAVTDLEWFNEQTRSVFEPLGLFEPSLRTYRPLQAWQDGQAMPESSRDPPVLSEDQGPVVMAWASQVIPASLALSSPRQPSPLPVPSTSTAVVQGDPGPSSARVVPQKRKTPPQEAILKSISHGMRPSLLQRLPAFDKDKAPPARAPIPSPPAISAPDSASRPAKRRTLPVTRVVSPAPAQRQPVPPAPPVSPSSESQPGKTAAQSRSPSSNVVYPRLVESSPDTADDEQGKRLKRKKANQFDASTLVNKIVNGAPAKDAPAQAGLKRQPKPVKTKVDISRWRPKPSSADRSAEQSAEPAIQSEPTLPADLAGAVVRSPLGKVRQRLHLEVDDPDLGDPYAPSPTQSQFGYDVSATPAQSVVQSPAPFVQHVLSPMPEAGQSEDRLLAPASRWTATSARPPSPMDVDPAETPTTDLPDPCMEALDIALSNSEQLVKVSGGSSSPASSAPSPVFLPVLQVDTSSRASSVIASSVLSAEELPLSNAEEQPAIAEGPPDCQPEVTEAQPGSEEAAPSALEPAQSAALVRVPSFGSELTDFGTVPSPPSALVEAQEATLVQQSLVPDKCDAGTADDALPSTPLRLIINCIPATPCVQEVASSVTPAASEAGQAQRARQASTSSCGSQADAALAAIDMLLDEDYQAVQLAEAQQYPPFPVTLPNALLQTPRHFEHAQVDPQQPFLPSLSIPIALPDLAVQLRPTSLPVRRYVEPQVGAAQRRPLPNLAMPSTRVCSPIMAAVTPFDARAGSLCLCSFCKHFRQECEGLLSSHSRRPSQAPPLPPPQPPIARHPPPPAASASRGQAHSDRPPHPVPAQRTQVAVGLPQLLPSPAVPISPADPLVLVLPDLAALPIVLDYWASLPDTTFTLQPPPVTAGNVRPDGTWPLSNLIGNLCRLKNPVQLLADSDGDDAAKVVIKDLLGHLSSPDAFGPHFATDFFSIYDELFDVTDRLATHRAMEQVCKKKDLKAKLAQFYRLASQVAITSRLWLVQLLCNRFPPIMALQAGISGVAAPDGQFCPWIPLKRGAIAYDPDRQVLWRLPRSLADNIRAMYQARLATVLMPRPLPHAPLQPQLLYQSHPAPRHQARPASQAVLPPAPGPAPRLLEAPRVRNPDDLRATAAPDPKVAEEAVSWQQVSPPCRPCSQARLPCLVASGRTRCKNCEEYSFACIFPEASSGGGTSGPLDKPPTPGALQRSTSSSLATQDKRRDSGPLDPAALPGAEGANQGLCPPQAAADSVGPLLERATRSIASISHDIQQTVLSWNGFIGSPQTGDAKLLAKEAVSMRSQALQLNQRLFAFQSDVNAINGVAKVQHGDDWRRDGKASYDFVCMQKLTEAIKPLDALIVGLASEWQKIRASSAAWPHVEAALEPAAPVAAPTAVGAAQPGTIEATPGAVLLPKLPPALEPLPGFKSIDAPSRSASASSSTRPTRDVPSAGQVAGRSVPDGLAPAALSAGVSGQEAGLVLAKPSLEELLRNPERAVKAPSQPALQVTSAPTASPPPSGPTDAPSQAAGASISTPPIAPTEAGQLAGLTMPGGPAPVALVAEVAGQAADLAVAKPLLEELLWEKAHVVKGPAHPSLQTSSAPPASPALAERLDPAHAALSASPVAKTSSTGSSRLVSSDSKLRKSAVWVDPKARSTSSPIPLRKGEASAAPSSERSLRRQVQLNYAEGPALVSGPTLQTLSRAPPCALTNSYDPENPKLANSTPVTLLGHLGR